LAHLYALNFGAALFELAMTATISNTVQAAISESRYQSSSGKFENALNTLNTVRRDIGSNDAVYPVQREINRIHLILGDHVSPSLSTSTIESLEQASNTYQELSWIQCKLNSISTSLELARPLQSAVSLFRDYMPVLDSEHEDECVVSLVLD
jgi:hypothetical protein